MNDQKNKQQQSPQQGNKQDPQSGKVKSRVQGDDIQEGDIEHPDQQPDRKVTIDDNPDETQKKVPNMQSKH